MFRRVIFELYGFLYFEAVVTVTGLFDEISVWVFLVAREGSLILCM